MLIPPESEALDRRGEEHFRLFLKERVRAGSVAYFCRPEWVVVPVDGDPFFVEVKTQDHYEAPPFDGHGLPVWQADRYLDLQVRLGMRTLLVVFEYAAGMEYWGWLDELQRNFFDTPGTRNGPRRIYPLSSFSSKPIAVAA
jgi:hypothetical protein